MMSLFTDTVAKATVAKATVADATVAEARKAIGVCLLAVLVAAPAVAMAQKRPTSAELIQPFLGDNYSQWAENIDADPNVRLRVEGAVYALRAVRVTDVAEMAGFAKAWTEKVSFGRDPTTLDEAFVYRLEPR